MPARQQGDTIPGTLADDQAFVASCCQRLGWKIAGRRFQFLQGDDIGRRAFQPVKEQVEPLDNIVDVPGRNPHSSAPFVALQVRLHGRSLVADGGDSTPGTLAKIGANDTGSCPSCSVWGGFLLLSVWLEPPVPGGADRRRRAMPARRGRLAGPGRQATSAPLPSTRAS